MLEHGGKVADRGWCGLPGLGLGDGHVLEYQSCRVALASCWEGRDDCGRLAHAIVLSGELRTSVMSTLIAGGLNGIG